MNFPQELRYFADHEWVSIKDDSEPGDIVFLELPDSGQAFKTGEIFGNVEVDYLIIRRTLLYIKDS